MGVKNITAIAIGMWPKTIAVNEIYLSSPFLTIAFHTAWRSAAKTTAINTFKDIDKLIAD